jgi:hypothetical protein
MSVAIAILVGYWFDRKRLPFWSLLSQTALVHQETEHKLPSNSHSQALCRRTVALVASLLLSVIVDTPCSGGATTPATAKGQGRATIVYRGDAIMPANRDVIKKIKDSGVFERMADRWWTVLEPAPRRQFEEGK